MLNNNRRMLGGIVLKDHYCFKFNRFIPIFPLVL